MSIPLSSKLEILDIDSMRGHGDMEAHRHVEASSGAKRQDSSLVAS
jgi:hypothetical protein